MNNDNKSPITKSIKVAIGIIITFSAICPFVLNHFVFNPPLGKTEWSNFLGSYLGGIIGGIGTLLAVYFTTKQTWKIQNSTTIQLNNDKAENRRKERIAFSNDIAVLISEFLSDMDTFVPRNISQKMRLEEFEKLTDTKIENIHRIQQVRDQPFSAYKEDQMKIEKKEQQRVDNQLEKLSQEISVNKTSRIVASKCHYLLKIKLSDIKQAKELLGQLQVTYDNITDCGIYIKESKKLLEITKQFIDLYIDTPCS